MFSKASLFLTTVSWKRSDPIAIITTYFGPINARAKILCVRKEWLICSKQLQRPWYSKGRTQTAKDTLDNV